MISTQYLSMVLYLVHYYEARDMNFVLKVYLTSQPSCVVKKNVLNKPSSFFFIVFFYLLISFSLYLVGHVTHFDDDRDIWKDWCVFMYSWEGNANVSCLSLVAYDFLSWSQCAMLHKFCVYLVLLFFFSSSESHRPQCILQYFFIIVVLDCDLSLIASTKMILLNYTIYNLTAEQKKKTKKIWLIKIHQM